MPTEIEIPMLQTKVPETANAEAISKNLDMADELREVAVTNKGWKSYTIDT